MSMRINRNIKAEGGFTLIELLVVIIIIGILAAIAIPMYLSQRQKGWQANVKSDLRNAAVAMESYYTDNSSYPNAINLIEGANTYGYNQSADITVSAPVASNEAGAPAGGLTTSYCIEAFHANNAGDIWSYDSTIGEPVSGGC